jgi:hypothetical protein
MSTITKRKISNCHFFRIIYSNGMERWVAFEAPNGPKLAVSEMKRLVQESEFEAATEQQGVVWYMGKLALWKELLPPKSFGHRKA